MVVVPSTTLSIGCWWKFIVLCMFVFHSHSHSRSLLSSSKYLLLVEGSEGSTSRNGANKRDSISSDKNNKNNNSVVTTEGFIIRTIVKNSSIISNAAAAVAAADDDDKEEEEEEDNAHRPDHYHDDPHNDLHLHLEHRMSISDMTCDYFQQPLNHFVPRGKSPTYMERYCTYDGYTVTANKTNNITTTTTTDGYNSNTITPIFFYTGNESPLEQYINQVRVRYHIILFLSFFSFFQMEI